MSARFLSRQARLLRTRSWLRILVSAVVLQSVLALSGCGSAASGSAASGSAASGSAASKIIGTWECGGGDKVTFTASGWSAEGTPSQNLPYKIQGDYIYTVTLARESVPMYKTKNGIVYDNTEGAGNGPWDEPCKKVP